MYLKAGLPSSRTGCGIRRGARNCSSDSSSSAESTISAAATLPKMIQVGWCRGSPRTAGERCRSQASAICAGVASWPLPPSHSGGAASRALLSGAGITRRTRVRPLRKREEAPRAHVQRGCTGLNSAHWHDSLCSFELLWVDVREPDVQDLSLVAKLREGSHRLLQRHGRSTASRSYRLIVSRRSRRKLASCLPQVLRPSVGVRLERAGSDEAGLHSEDGSSGYGTGPRR